MLLDLPKLDLFQYLNVLQKNEGSKVDTVFEFLDSIVSNREQSEAIE